MQLSILAKKLLFSADGDHYVKPQLGTIQGTAYHEVSRPDGATTLQHPRLRKDCGRRGRKILRAKGLRSLLLVSCECQGQHTANTAAIDYSYKICAMITPQQC